MKIRIRNGFWVLLVFVLLATGDYAVRADVTRVTLSSPGTFGEDDDYFSRVWGNPRDMAEKSDLYLLSSTCNPKVRAKWTNSSFAGGIWSAVTSSVGETRTTVVLNPGWASSLDAGEDGELRKIDTQHYTQLTFRMRVASGAGTSTQVVKWADGPIGTTVQRSRKRFRVQGDGLWHVYTMDLSRESVWSNAPVSWLWFEFENFSAGHLVEVDWVRLTPRQTRRVQWQGNSLSGSAKVYLGPNVAHPEWYGDLLIFGTGETPLPIDASSGTLVVPASLPPGTYYARVGVGGGGANSIQSWRFLPLPIAEITAPSYTSGEDWATAVLGNPWDMQSLGDISVATTAMDAIRSMNVSNGVLTVVTKDDGMADCAAPWPHLPLGLNLGGKRIDQKKYRYFSYRYKADQAPDQGAGGMHRVRWQARYLQYWPTGRTDDLSFYDDAWRTYHVDLVTVQQEGEMGQWEDFSSDVLQIMLHEKHRQWTTRLDWVKLTAENVAAGSYVVRWKVKGTSVPVKTTLYWAQKQGSSYRLVSGSGQVVGAPPAQGVQAAQGHVVYLPYVASRYGGKSGELFYIKSTQGLTKGQAYYVAIKLEDGYNETMWYSPVPVRVR